MPICRGERSPCTRQWHLGSPLKNEEALSVQLEDNLQFAESVKSRVRTVCVAGYRLFKKGRGRPGVCEIDTCVYVEHFWEKHKLSLGEELRDLGARMEDDEPCVRKSF